MKKTMEELKKLVDNSLKRKEKMKKEKRDKKEFTLKQYCEVIYRGRTLPLVYEKHGQKCFFCGSTLKVGGHHLLGRNIPYNYLNPNLIIPLCEKHHKAQKSMNLQESQEFREASCKIAEELDVFEGRLDAVLDQCGVDLEDFYRNIVPEDLKSLAKKIKNERRIR